MKNKTIVRVLIIFGIILVVGSIAAFLLVRDYTPKFWISYVACVVALCTLAFGILITGRNINYPSSHLFHSVSAVYTVAVVVFVILGYGIFPLGVKIYAVIHLILFALYLIRMIVALIGHEYIVNQDKGDQRQIMKTHMDTERVTQLIEMAADLPEDLRAQAEKTLHPVEEKLRYSDPMQSKETADQAHEVELALDSLEEAMDSLMAGKSDLTLLTQTANVAIRKINAYNRAKKNGQVI